MNFTLRRWSWIFLIACTATAQDFNINPNAQNDISSTFSSINDPFTPTPRPGANNFDFGLNNQNGPPLDNPYNPQTNQYDPNNPQNDPNNPRNGQYDPNNPQTAQYDPNNPRNGQYDPNNPRNEQYDPNRGRYDPYGKSDQFGGRWRGHNDYGYGRNEIDSPNSAIREATYFITSSKTVRPGQLYRVVVNILREGDPLTVRASITRNGVEMSEDHKVVKQGVPETLLMRVPPTSVPGNYKLRVEGLYDDVLGVVYFSNETNLIFSQRSMTIFIQLDKPVFMQGEKVRFRAIPINTELKAFNEAIDVYILDPSGHIMKRWLSKQTNLGTVSLNYQLSDQPVFGEWKVRVIAQNQIEESSFLVEEYYQTRFEVNVTMGAFFLNTDPYIEGVVMANYTSGAPVKGNLTLKALVRPIKPIDPHRMRNKNRNRNRDRYFNERVYNRYDDRRYGPQDEYSYLEDEYEDHEYNKPILEKYFNFEEAMPFWLNIPQDYYEPIPSLKFFYGAYHFKYPIQDLLHHVPTLDGMEVVVVATVGDRFLDEVIEGYSTARIFNSSIKVAFLGGSPQVYKPGMPVTTYLAASFHDGSSLPPDRLANGVMEVFTYIETGSSGRRDLPSRQLIMLDGNPGVWEYRFDVKNELGAEDLRSFNDPYQGGSIRVQARFRDGIGNHAETELQLYSHFSPNKQHIKVFTTTKVPQVGANMIFHIKSNFFIRKFSYLIIAKGIILVSSDQDMDDYIATMSVPLSAEMAPVATIVVWHLGRYGEVTVDSLTFPVNGISRNKFRVYINNRKARTGHEVEVAIYGEPGSYVGISGIDRAFYTMQAGNELTYAKVIKKMASFDENINGTHEHIWFSHEGNPDELVYFPSSTYGIDANRTFAYAGLVVFSDFELPRRWSQCNASWGDAECLSGGCYRMEKRCDYINDCVDGTDEAGCNYDNGTELAIFRKYRFNRIQRQYENVWVWKDVNIGPHGRYIFNVPVPARPVHWMVSAFSMSPSLGFGMLNKAIEYIGVLPFFINVEMPNTCMQGEQIGIRVTVFNYMTDAMEATVVLLSSPDYKFVHVEENGVVRSYNPRTSFGEHQFFIYIKPQDAAVVYLPIVPTRLGDIEVTVYASTLIGKDQITRKLHVGSDGIPQHRHQSMLLDLSTRAYAFQHMHVNVTKEPKIPYQYDRYYVYGSNKATLSVVGDVVGAIFPTMPMNTTSMLHLPMDSAEQNMFSFAANMYTVLYMRYTQQRNKTLEKMAFHYMNVGYQRQLSFLQTDGSFSLFRSDWNQSASSVWLTAYCARVLQEASFYEWENYIYIDPVVISKSVEWILRHQTPQGSFYETTWSPDRKYNSSINFDNDPVRHRNISLTAHVLVTLEVVKDLTSGLSSKVAIAQKDAVWYLEKNMDLIINRAEPFDLALVAYALMKSKSAFAENAYVALSSRRREEGGLVYWGRKAVPAQPYRIENQKPFLLPRLPYEFDSENIEATAYALMVYVARQEIMMNNIVRWLNTQRLTENGWASTMDTANALKALIEYTSAQRIRDVSTMSVMIEASCLPSNVTVLNVNQKNRGTLQQFEIENAWGTVKVQAKGTGYAVLQMHVQYNVDVARFQTSPPVPAFDLWVRPHFYGRNMSHITFFSCQRWTHLNESARSGLAVLDVTVPTGYMIQQQDLDAYTTSRRVRNLQRARFTERKVVFYFNYLDNEETCVNFTVERWHPVANMTRYLPIRVYDYYAPERFNEIIFDALSTYVLDICHVCGSSQCPYCWIYNGASRMSVSFVTLTFTTFILMMRYFRQDHID